MAMQLTQFLATAIVNTIKHDPECRRRIVANHSGMLMAGQIRNADLSRQNAVDAFKKSWNPLDLIPGAPDETPRDIYICTGIADATCKAINTAIKYAPSGILAGYIERAMPASCALFKHAGTGIIFRKQYSNTWRPGNRSADNVQYDCVLDYWQTLDINNPFIFLTQRAFDVYLLTLTYDRFMGKSGVQMLGPADK